jgi:hypothetical protein
MRKAKIFVSSTLAVFVLSAVASAASASAIGWWVENKPVGAGENFEFSDIQTVAGAKSVILFHKNEIQIECPEISFVNAKGEETGESNPNPPDTLLSEAFLEGTNGGSIHEIQFSDCKVIKPSKAGCEVTEDDISTGQITATLSTTAAKVTLKPKSPSTSFATFKLTAGCGVLAGSYTVKGSTVFTISEPESCKEVHKITIAETPSTLEVAGEKVNTFEVVRNLEGVESDKCWDAK